jgi:hypothetical protein
VLNVLVGTFGYTALFGAFLLNSCAEADLMEGMGVCWPCCRRSQIRQ